MSNKRDKNSTRDEMTQARRRLIIESAAECFLAKGFHQTSVRDIASKAGVSLGNLYNHYDGKEALIAEIAMLEAEELKVVVDAMTGADDPVTTIKQFADDYLSYASAPENAVLAAEIITESMRNPTIGEGFETNRKTMAQALASVLSQGIKLGQFDPELDTKESAHLILDLIEGLAMRSAFSGRKPTTGARKALTTMIGKSIHA